MQPSAICLLIAPLLSLVIIIAPTIRDEAFESDVTLSNILSKALLLRDNNKITNTVILCQIRWRRV